MGHAVFTEFCVADGPTAVLARERHLHGLWAWRLKEFLKPELLSSQAQHTRCNAPHELLTSPVHNAQTLLLVKGKNSHINLHYYFLEECRGFQFAHFLLLQPYGQRIDFIDQVGQGIIAPTATQAKGKI